MHPELFTIPFLHVTIRSYGFMMLLGFIAALLLARYRSKKVGINPDHISNFAVLALITGVLGARLFYVIHNWDEFSDNPATAFAIWSGGLEFYGGLIAAVGGLFYYCHRKKLSVMQLLDILAPAVMLGLAFGRIGCFLNGCCFGAPCSLNMPLGVRFPAVNMRSPGGFSCSKPKVPEYSIPFDYQLRTDFTRRNKPLVTLPDDYYDGYTDGEGHWVASKELIPPGKKYYRAVKPPSELTPEQLKKLENGTYGPIKIHPAQLYSSANALSICLVLLLLNRWFKREGQMFAWLLILYGIMRFVIEMVRNSSPVGFDGLTISQNVGLITVPAGFIILLLTLTRRKSTK